MLQSLNSGALGGIGGALLARCGGQGDDLALALDRRRAAQHAEHLAGLGQLGFQRGQVAGQLLAALARLLAERPSGTGLAVPGMPAGSPGMDFSGVEPEPYEVLLFGPTTQTFGRYLGAQEI